MISRILKVVITRRNLLAMISTGFIGAKFPAIADVQSPTIKLSTSTPTKVEIKVSTSTKTLGYIEYGTKSGEYLKRTKSISISNGTVIALINLQPSTQYFARLRYFIGSSKTARATAPLTFETPNNLKGSIFAVQADPHMDENSDEKVYLGTLQQVKAASPAFLMDLGDIFMVDKLQDKSESNIRARFELMKNYYKTIGKIRLV